MCTKPPLGTSFRQILALIILATSELGERGWPSMFSGAHNVFKAGGRPQSTLS